MLNGPALLRVFLVVIAAAVLTGLVQHYWIFETSEPETPAVAARPSAPARRPDPAPARPPTQEAPAPQAAAPPPEPTRPSPAPVAEPKSRNADSAPSSAPEPVASPPSPIRSAPSVPAPSPAPAPDTQATAPPEEPAQDEVAAAETADPRALDLVDLNTGSLAELNGLKGGGAIGRAIIQHRPYTSTDQLLSKRVLSRSLYQRIKAQVTVR